MTTPRYEMVFIAPASALAAVFLGSLTFAPVVELTSFGLGGYIETTLGLIYIWGWVMLLQTAAHLPILLIPEEYCPRTLKIGIWLVVSTGLMSWLSRDDFTTYPVVAYLELGMVLWYSLIFWICLHFIELKICRFFRQYKWDSSETKQ